MNYTLQFRDVFAQRDALLHGVAITMGLTATTVSLGLCLGLLAAVAVVYGSSWIRRIAQTFIEVIRNTPLLVQLFVMFFGLPSLGLKLDAFTISILALAINAGAYSAEIIRAGIESIPNPQIEAGLSLGLSRREVFTHIVLVPALKKIYPALTGQFVLMMLATSVASQIAAPELFYAGSIIQSRTYRDFEVYIVISVIYLGLSLVLRALFRGLHHVLFRFP